MKIPGKFPINTITKKLSTTEKTAVDKVIGTSSTKNIVSVNTKEILYKKSRKTFSTRLLNYVEPYLIKGQRYTLFYTEVEHNLNVGNRVFITGGNYDSDLIIQDNKFNKLSDGYIVQYVDRTKLVLDIEYTGDLPWNDEPIDSYINIYVANTQDEFNYYLQNISTKSFDYVTNKFSLWGTSSNGNVLYTNGTFSLSEGLYGILGVTQSVNPISFTVSNSFYTLFGTQSGFLEDISNLILDKSVEITGSTIVIGSFTYLTITTNKPHKIPILEVVDIELSDLSGVGSSSWIGSWSALSLTINTLQITRSGSYATTITSGTASNLPLPFNNLDKLRIVGSDFDKSGIKFKDNYIYYYDSTDLIWKVDRTSLKPIVNEQNFRNGFFKKGEYNQGLLGTHQETINYSGENVNFTLGTVLNVNWQVGNIGKGTGNDLSYFTSFDEFGLPNIKVNSKNNGGLGYNYFYDSYIKSSTIENGTFEYDIIGVPNGNVVTDYLEGQSHTYSVSTKGGNYINSDIVNSYLLSSAVFSSNIENSNLVSSKSINSEFERTLFLKSKFNSEKIIKILAYDEKYVKWYKDYTLVDYKLYKFYISEDNFERFKNFQSFYIDGLQINKPGASVLNLFDDKFTIDAYLASDEKYDSTKFTKKVIVQLSSVEENSRIFTGNNSLLINNIKKGTPSIDILIDMSTQGTEDFNTGYIPEEYGPYYFDISTFISSAAWGQSGTQSTITVYYNSNDFEVITSTFSNSSLLTDLNNLLIGSWTYSGNTFSVVGGYSFEQMSYVDGFDDSEQVVDSFRNTQTVISESLNQLDISKAYIIDSDFQSGYFKDSTWISGNYINYNHDSSLETQDDKLLISSINDSNSGELLIDLSSKNRKDLFKEFDTMFLNGFYYDTSVTGGENLVKLPNTYKIKQYDSSNRSVVLVDPKNPTNSVLFNVSPGVSDFLVTSKFALNSYNYVHPVKFENSKISSGLFRRAFFENCVIENQLFNNLDKDPVNFNNWRSLLLSDILFTDNGNKIKNGLVINSSLVSGSDTWENGIFYNSIWNVQPFTYSFAATGSTVYTTSVNKFKNGIFKESTWINGVFENGLFYKNRSNAPFKIDVYDNLKPAYYRSSNTTLKRTRYSWENGIFENGIFEMSNFETGTFSNGDFYNSTFFTGNAVNGNFGKRNLKYELTRVASGSFSNVNVISAEFRSENPTGQMDGVYQIDWYNGVFNNGVFGVKMDLGSYSNLGPNYIYKSTWYDGVFNNGYFSDIAVWKDGEFNNGRFTSFYGYPWVTAASYSSSSSSDFTWQDGQFNGGEFGNAQTGTNSTWFDGEFNNGIFRGRYWNNGVFKKGFFIGSGTGSTKLSNVPNFVSEFSDQFYGLWNDGIVQEIKTVTNPQKRLFTKLEREFTKKRKRTDVEFKNMLWRSGTFSHNSGLFQNSIWTGGAFYKGKFHKSSFNPYLNYLVNGNFQDINQDSLNDIKYWTQKATDYDENGNKIGGNVLSIPTQLYSSDNGVRLEVSGTPSIVNLSQTAGLVIGDTYTLKLLIDGNYNNEIRFGSSDLSLRNRNFFEGSSYWTIACTSSGTVPDIIISTGSVHYDPDQSDSNSYLIYPNILEVGKDYFFKFYTFSDSNFVLPYIGSCDSSQVSIEDGVLGTDFTVGTNLTYSVPDNLGTGVYVTTFNAEYTDFVINFRTGVSLADYNISGLILSGNTNVITSENITSRRSITYTFNADGPNFALDFISDATRNPSAIPTFNAGTSSLLSIEVIKGTQSAFNTSDSCFWDNGTFEDSEFYVSKWNNGKWISGTAVGMIWKNGVANYMNAYNVYWEGGVWRNGNWNGSPFNYENINPNGCLYLYNPTDAFNTTSVWNNIDLSNDYPSGLSIVLIDPVGTGAYIHFNDGGGFTSTYQDPELDPTNISGAVYNNGFVYFNDATVNSLNTRYKITIQVGTISIANSPDSETVGIQFSLGKPSYNSYGGGTYPGGLYPSLSDIASGEDYISYFYTIKNLEGHTGQVIEGHLLPGIDGYLGSGGIIEETLTARDDAKLYIHLNTYGANEIYIDSITIEEEVCNPRIEVNDGYVSDILTNVSLYRQSKSDSGYRDAFINDAFTVSTDLNWPPVPSDISISMTMSFGVSPKWTYATGYFTRTLTSGCTIGGKGSFGYSIIVWSEPNYPGTFEGLFLYIFWIISLIVPKKNWSSIGNSTNYLYAINDQDSKFIFTELGTYDITLKYVMQYGPTVSQPVFSGSLINFPCSMQVEVGYASGVNNGGFKETITNTMRVYPIGCNSTSTGQYFGTTPELTWSATFEPTALGSTFSQLDQFRLKKISSSVIGMKVIITDIIINKKITNYDPVYNNATYSMMDTTPSFNDSLLLPQINMIGGQSNGNIISTRFGNGIFTSGTASAYSSIWENGVWNDGLRYDNNIYIFDDLSVFPGTNKPYSFSGDFKFKTPKLGVIPTKKDRNLTEVKKSSKNWIIVIRQTRNYIQFDNGEFKNQVDFNASQYFKEGDVVSVGNLSCIDLNGNRRLIKDYFKVVSIDVDTVNGDLVYLQININFPIRRIEKDSSDHLIYVSKNVWLSGVFLNGLFKGVWTNGLFKGRPYITRMVDSQWVDGRFDGGHFRGLTLSVYDTNIIEEDSEDVEINYFHSGLIQNFVFNSRNIQVPLEFTYDSWMEVNYERDAAVAINKDILLQRSANIGSYKFAENNFYGYPTKDILSSVSKFRNGTDIINKDYRLGWKFERYDQFLPYDGEFKKPFDNLTDRPGINEFTQVHGWTWSFLNEIYTQGSNPYDGELLYRFKSNIQDVDSRGGLNIGLNNAAHAGDGWTIEDGTGMRIDNYLTNFDISNSGDRYSMIEFEIDYIGPTYSWIDFYGSPPFSMYPPATAFGGIQSYNLLDPVYYYGETYSYKFNEVIVTNFGTFIKNEAYPLNHLATNATVKTEYFYNRAEINFYFSVISGDYGTNISGNYDSVWPDEIDYRYFFKNIKYTEVDMIPFFMYATESRINQKILAPYSSTAPFIDYSENDFSLLDNVIISETLFETVTNPVTTINGGGMVEVGFAFDVKQQPTSKIKIGTSKSGSPVSMVKNDTKLLATKTKSS